MKSKLLRRLTAGLAAMTMLCVSSAEGFAAMAAEVAAAVEAKQTAQSATDASDNDGDGQQPVQSVISMSTAAVVNATLVNMVSGSTVFGVTVPVHSTAYALHDKYMGIDVSKWNGDINWAKVKASGVNYAIIRVGYRGYGSGGTLVLDSKFKDNIEGALENDIKVGVYFFTQAINTAEAVEEAKFAIKQIKDYDISLPVIIDIEEAVDSSGAVTGRVHDAKLTKTQYTNICAAFCDTVKDAGYQPMVYANPNWLNNKLNTASLESKYGIWLANYTSKTTYTGDYQIWQYSSKGKVTGISGSTDLNILYVMPPQTPKNLAAKVNSDLSITVSWSKAEGAEGYVLYGAERKNGSLTYSTVATTTKTSYKISKGNYCAFAVASYKTEDGKKRYSETSKEITLYSGDTPSGVTVDNYTSTTLTVSWKSVKNATGYEVYLRKKGASSYTLAAETEKNSVKLSGLSAATEYEIKVCATFEAGVSAFTEAYGAATTPAVPTSVKVSSVTATTAKVSWKAVSGAERYLVYALAEDGENYKLVKRTNTNSAEVTGLDSAKTYYFKIRSVVDGDSMTAYSSASSTAETCTKPAKVSSVSSTVAATSVTLKWKKTGDNVTYRIYKYNYSAKKYERIATTKSLSYTVKGLSKFTKYQFAVNSANKNDVLGGYSSTGDIYTGVLKPTGLKTSATSTSVTLSWNKISGMSGYVVYVLGDDGYSRYKTLTGTSVTIKDVPKGKSYTFKVKAYKNIGGANRYSAASDAAYIATSPQAVKNVTFDHTKAKENTVTVSWSKTPYASGYNVYLYDSSNGKYSSVAKVTKTSATISLAPGKNYTFKVRAYTTVGGKNYYGGYSAKVDTFTRSSAPSDITISANTTSTVTIKWSKQTGAKGYYVYRYNSNGSYTLIGDTTSTSYKISGLSAGSSYKYSVRSYRVWQKAVWYSSYSAAATVCTLPSKPTSVKYKSSTDESVTLSWAKVNGASGYSVYVYDESSKKYVLGANSTSTSATVSGLDANKTYTFAVKAYKTNSSKKYYSAYSSTLKAKTVAAPPKTVKLSSVSKTTAKISWSKSSGATGYKVYKYDYSGKKWVAIGETTALSYTFKNLAPEEKCLFAVKPYMYYNGANRYAKNYSKISVATSALLPPETVKISSVNKTTAKISWSKSADAAGYRLYKYNYSSKKWVVIGETTALSYTFKDLAPSEDCLFAVKPYLVSGGKNCYASKYSKISVTTSALLPPETLTAEEITYTSAKISWSKSDGADGYRVYKYDYENKKWISLEDISELDYTFENLIPSEDCLFAVKPYLVSGGKKHFAETYSRISVVTPTLLPPETLTAEEITCTSAKISWSKSDGADGYRVYKYDYENKKWISLEDISELNYTFENLVPSEDCLFAVKPYLVSGGKKHFAETYSRIAVTTLSDTEEETGDDSEEPTTEQNTSEE